MVTIKLVTLVMVAMLFLSGCSVKKADTTTKKVLVHTANAPFYVAAGAIKVTKLALAVALMPAFYVAKQMSDDNKSLEQNVTKDDANKTLTYTFDATKF